MSERESVKPRPDSADSAGQVVAVRQRNVCPEPMWYGVEPWGEGYDLHSGRALLTLLQDRPSGEYLEVVLDETSVTTWSDTGTTHTVFDGETELGPGIGLGPPVPPYPWGSGRPILPLGPPAVFRVELLLLNKGALPLVVSAPTQSEQYTLLPGDKCAVIAAGISDGTPELELAEDAVTVYGWPAAQVAIAQGGGGSVTS